MVDAVTTKPAVAVRAPSSVDIALRRTAAGKLSLHLASLAGAQRAPRFITVDDVPPVPGVTVTLRVPERPTRLRWVPDGGQSISSA